MRRAVVAFCVLVGCGLLAGALSTGALAQDGGGGNATALDDCAVIDQPGEYELTNDVRSNESAPCLEVRADDVVLDGNGHAVEGPGSSDDEAVGVYVAGEDVVVRNVEVVGWTHGVEGDNADLTVENATVRDGEVGFHLVETGETVLRNVTIADNEVWGLDTDRIGTIRGSNVTVRGNGAGLGTWDSHGVYFEESRFVDNEGHGIALRHHSSLTLVDSRVDGNGGSGILAVSRGSFSVDLTVEGGTVSGNAEDGVTTFGPNTDVEMTGVTVADNGDLAVRGYAPDQSDSHGNVTARDVDVGPSATVAFTAEPVNLQAVPRGSLPPLPEGAAAAGDGLDVGGPVDGPFELELAVDTDDDTVDVGRHDGDEWETVAANVPVSDGTVEVTVERNGTYAPVTEADGAGGSDEDSEPSDEETDDSTDDGNSTDDSDSDSSSGPGSDSDSNSDSDTDGSAGENDADSTDDSTGDEETNDGSGTNDTGGDDGAGDGGTNDGTDDATRDSSGSDTTDSSDGPDGSEDSSTLTPTPTDSTPESGSSAETPTESEPVTVTGVGDSNETEDGTPTEGAEAATETATGTDADDDTGGEVVTAEEPSPGDGAGFGVVAAVTALLGALLFRRR